MSWMKFAVGEGLTKTVSSLVQKTVGREMGTLVMGAVAGIIIGIIQCASGLASFFKRSKKVSLVPEVRSVMWALIFGFMASTFGTIWSIYTFTLGADIGIRTLLIMGSIIPGAIMDRVIWKDEFKAPQILGIFVFLVAVWAMLDFPSAKMVLHLPVWVPAVLVITFTQSINEALSRASSVKMDPWVNNFWVGGSSVFCCITALVAMVLFSGGATLKLTNTFLLGSIVLGGIVIFMIALKMLSYFGGGTIALKKVVMNGVFLVTSATAGIIVYNEPFTAGKVVGAILFFVSFALTDNATRKFVFAKIKIF